MYCTNAITEAHTSKCIESGVMLLPAGGRENLKDGKLNSKLKGSQAVGFGCNYTKDISKTIDDGSIASIIGERNSPAFVLPMKYPTDHYLRHELLDDFSVEESLEESSMSRGVTWYYYRGARQRSKSRVYMGRLRYNDSISDG
jgi:hypothetical protein